MSSPRSIPPWPATAARLPSRPPAGDQCHRAVGPCSSGSAQPNAPPRSTAPQTVPHTTQVLQPTELRKRSAPESCPTQLSWRFPPAKAPEPRRPPGAAQKPPNNRQSEILDPSVLSRHIAPGEPAPSLSKELCQTTFPPAPSPPRRSPSVIPASAAGIQSSAPHNRIRHPSRDPIRTPSSSRRLQPGSIPSLIFSHSSALSPLPCFNPLPFLKYSGSTMR